MAPGSLPKEGARNVILIDGGGIAFPRDGIAGTFESAWGIDGTMDMRNIGVIDLAADLIRGGTPRPGGSGNGNGAMEVRSAGGPPLGRLDRDGPGMWAADGSRIEIDASRGPVGYGADGNPAHGADDGAFRMADGRVDGPLAVGGPLK